MANAECQAQPSMSGMCRVRSVLLTICALGVAWGAVVIATGGIAFRIGFIRVSAHPSFRAFLPAVIAAVLAVALPAPGGWRGALHALGQALNPARLAAWTGILLFIQQWAIARPLWLDEEMIALNVRERSLWDLARGLWLGQSAPFGWLAAERISLTMLGDGERAMRLVPALFGVGTLLAAWWIGRRWLNTLATALLVVLMALGEWVAFYCFELKHYAGDLFWALLIPALGAALLEAVRREQDGMLTRAMAWWLAAAAGQFLSNGALLVTPGVALAVAILLAATCGRRAALVFTGAGLVWLGAFGWHYVLSIRHTLGSAFLEHYWKFAVPPPSAGLFETFGWLGAQMRPFAVKPGGTGLWILFWIAAFAGLALSRKRQLGLLFATVPVSAAVLAALRVVPLYERISLWVVPALYVGLALLLDEGITLAKVRRARRGLLDISLAVLAVGAVTVLSFDIVQRGIEELRGGRPADSNHLLDDRTAVRWLTKQIRPGDVLVSTHLALPAIWWYGNLPIDDSAGAGSRTPAGNPVVQVRYKPGGGPECRTDSLQRRLAGAQRALVYFGFRFDDVPRGFDDLLLRDLSRLGIVADFRDFAGVSRAAVFDLGAPGLPSAGAPPARGCLVAARAERW